MPFTKIAIKSINDMMKNLVYLFIEDRGKKMPPINPSEYGQVLSYRGLINHKVEFCLFKVESWDMNKFGRVQTRTAISLAVAYLMR